MNEKFGEFGKRWCNRVGCGMLGCELWQGIQKGWEVLNSVGKASQMISF